MKRGRRKKIRYLQKMPSAGLFSPRGRPGRPNEVELSLDEFEAIKLTDFQGYDQSEGAQAMGISRPSFGRILRKARYILADAIVNAKSIRIRTGDAQVGVRQRNLPARKDVTPGELVELLVRRNILNYSPEKYRSSQISPESSSEQA